MVVSNTGSLVTPGSSYTPPTFARPTSRILSLASLPGFNFTLTSADLVNVTVDQGTAIANLPANQFTVDLASDTITLAAGVSLVGIDRVEVSIAAPAVHEAGDPVLYYGDEPIMVGQPVVNGSGSVVQDAERPRRAIHRRDGRHERHAVVRLQAQATSGRSR